MSGVFDDLVDTWLAEEMEDAPVRASALGIPGHDDRLGDFSAARFEARAGRDSRWLASVDAINPADLSFEQSIDRDLLRSTLGGRLIFQDWTVWRRDPVTYLFPCLQGVFTLLLHRLRPEPELVAAASARLRAFRRYWPTAGATWMAGSGAMPIALAERAVTGP